MYDKTIGFLRQALLALMEEEEKGFGHPTERTHTLIKVREAILWRQEYLFLSSIPVKRNPMDYQNNCPLKPPPQDG